MPSRFGRYAVRRRIGSGGFATVWLAYDDQLDSPVAVKVLAENWAGDAHVRDRFVEEGRYLRRVESPYVVTVYDAGALDDGRPYLVMTYADQGTLADRVELDTMAPEAALAVVRQVGEGLSALHERGIVHRDVKPANVLFRSVDDTLRAMVGDLGLGKALDASSRLTMIAGSPTYVAPEQAAGESPDARADQYSLGVVTYLLLSGRAPWSLSSLGSASEPPPVPPLSREERPFGDEVEQVVRRALAPDREERYPDVASYVAALVAALAPVLDDEPGVLPSPGGGRLVLDPDLTRPGAAPAGAREPAGAHEHAGPTEVVDGEPPTATDPSAAGDPHVAGPATRRRGLSRRATVVTALAGLVALGAGAVGGWALEGQVGPGEVAVEDATGSLVVSVPDAWAARVAGDGWVPPLDEAGSFPAVAAGTSSGWRRDGQGVFVGLLPGSEVPDTLPQHPECDTVRSPYSSTEDGRRLVTVVSTGCPQGVIVERVAQATDNQLLWVQVRSADQATANRVLDSVETVGL